MNTINTTGSLLLQSVKESTTPNGPVLSLPVGSPVEAILRPVATREDALSTDDVRVLTHWRNRFVRSFLTEFVATETRTSRWLTRTVGPDTTRILFMLDDAQSGHPIGYMGLAFISWGEGYGEADAIVRGGDGAPGLMSRAMQVMLDWARRQLGMGRIGVRVRSDNSALEFFHKFGFRELRRVPLRRLDSEGMIQWIEDPASPSSGPCLVHMILP